jgi:hypothetical protein
MKTLLILVASTLLSLPAHARIGETPEQCQARYGAAIKADKAAQSILFSKAGLNVMTFFREGKCVRVGFWKSEVDILNSPLALSDAEKEALLDANGGGAKWRKLTVLDVNAYWQTVDEKLTASYVLLENMLIIQTTDEMNRTIAEQQAKEKAKLKDF